MASFRKTSDQVYQAESLLDFDWLEHGFGTRNSVAWNQDADLVSLSQIHSSECVHVTAGQGRVGRGDALLTGTPGLRVGVRTADCIPLVLTDPVRRAVAVVHAGWRGTAQSIAVNAVRKLQELFGSQPEEIVTAIGPGIGPCCYEVGPEVASEFRAWFPGIATHLDLPEANRRQLLAAGLAESRISVARLCTCCMRDEFHSWRRDRQAAGRMVSAARIIQKERGAGKIPRPSPKSFSG